ncbi:LruC domain-containing protein [Marinobacter hydrocarbonoclasticus]|nr:LruC domain-containing protein [Marinobacter nauticus]
MKSTSCLSILLLLLASAAQAIDYQHLTGGPAAGYSQKGKPDSVTNINNTLPGNVLNNIYDMLPEGTAVNPSYIAPDIKSNIEIDPDLNGYATVQVAFLNEGAGYRNALGFFVYDTDAPPASYRDITAHTLIFPNSSKPPEGSMKQGDQVDLGVQLTAGQSIGFFVVPNGWGWSGSYGNISSDGPWNQPFYSLSGLNPERKSSDRRHNVVFVDTQNDLLMLGFDDQLYTAGDKDFNDLLIAVNVTPFEAVDGINADGSIDSGSYIPLALSDGSDDEVITAYYPSMNGYATLAFEDRWPEMGDYDYNDVVVRYRMTLTQTTNHKLKAMTLDAHVQALGATFKNGLAWRLPKIDEENIESVTLTRNGAAVPHTVLEMDGRDAVMIISPDLKADVGSSCDMYRTQAACQESENTNYQLTLTLSSPVPLGRIGDAPFDPFIFATEGEFHGNLGYDTAPGRRWELHLKTFCGTSEFDSALLGMSDDNSSGNQCYLNNNNVPWAINIADSWSHPKEYKDILSVYGLLRNWVDSSGYEYNEWYKRKNADANKLYD